MEELTPSQIVDELDRYIVGQNSAKRAVAIALRNRYRRKHLPAELQDEVMPKNIILIGPTGVGKTEIARRLAKLVKAPFIKVEATKFTEVGYVGRDVEAMVRDLCEVSIRMVRQEKLREVEEKAKKNAEERLLDLLLPVSKKQKSSHNPLELLFKEFQATPQDDAEEEKEKETFSVESRQTLQEKLQKGLLEDDLVVLEIEERTPQMLEVFSAGGMEEMGINIQDMLGNLMPRKKRNRKLTVAEARKILTQEEAQKLIDMDEVVSLGIYRVEQSGIIFLDEIDKIAGRETGSGPDVSRGGVQRDILPLVEGTSVVTKYGPVRTDHILFIAAGAFHYSRPADLIPELQGRFPIRVELEPLTSEDFLRILTEPDNSLIRQYTELMQTEEVKLTFTSEALKGLAEVAYQINQRTENIGARRLHTVLEKVLEDISYQAPNLEEKHITIDLDFINTKLAEVLQDEDLSRYIL